jgi:signal transduction histidine kinase
MRELAAYLEEAREKERTAIARDLHDQCGQGLTALRFDLETIMKGLRAADSQASVHLADSIKLIDRLAEEVRSLSAELRPGMLDDLGLCAAIEWHVGRFSERTAIPCELSLPEDDSAVSPVHATAVYRILQELLTNVARHSQATRVRIRLERSDGNLVLTVEDNGKGIDKKSIESKESLGLLGIRERVRPLGGGVVIGSTRGKGTTVVVQLPLVRSDMPPANDTQG